MASQKRQELEWKAARGAKSVKVQSTAVTEATPPTTGRSGDYSQELEDPVTLLCQQLAVKTEECRHLTDRLQNIENVNAKIVSNQKVMQECLVKVMFLQVVVVVVGC